MKVTKEKVILVVFGLELVIRVPALFPEEISDDRVERQFDRAQELVQRLFSAEFGTDLFTKYEIPKSLLDTES